MNNEFELKLKELRKGYINKLKDLIPSFEDLLNADSINIEEIYIKVHTVSGTSGMYGLKELSDASAEFESYLKPYKENPTSINIEELKAKFLNYLEFMKTEIIGA